MKIGNITKGLTIAFSFVFIFSALYIAFEPTITSAVEDEVVVRVNVTEDISITSPSDATLSGTIYGMTGGTATGSLTWTVKTTNTTGFAMTIKASQTNALYLDGTYYFTDYTPASGGVPDYDWSAPAASAAEFGFTVEAETAGDTVQNFLDNASNACNEASGSQTVDKCWLGLNGTTPISIINRTTNTDSSGEAEVVKFKADSQSKYLKEGEYNATITVTATMNG